MTWEVRAVDKTGALLSVVAGVDVQRVVDELNGRESATLSIPTLHADATYLDLFENEIQLWWLGDDEPSPALTDESGVPLTDESGNTLEVGPPTLMGWYAPAILDADRSGQNDSLTIQCTSLFSYFHDVVIGGQLPNHATSPHDDPAPVGSPPSVLSVTANVEDAAIVDNNVTFGTALQLNNSEAGQDAYAYERIPVTADMVGVPLFAGAEVYVAEGDGVGDNPPPWGGAAYKDRGLMIHRLDSTTFEPLSKPQVAPITDETPRNTVEQLFTPGVLPASTDEVIEIRYYAPSAWTVWRFSHLRDDRAVAADRVDKSVAVQLLVEAAQDTDLGWYDHGIGTDLVDLGETITMSWPWWRRDIPGEQIEGLADSFDFRMDFPDVTPGSAVRNLKIHWQIGSDLTSTVTLTKEDFVGWGLGMSRQVTANRVIRQGGGSGAARFERWEEDLTSLGGHVRAALVFAAPGELVTQMRDNTQEELARRKTKPKLPRARIVGDLAKTIRAGDTVAVNLDHGWAQFTGNARVMKKELDGASMVATLDLEPL